MKTNPGKNDLPLTAAATEETEDAALWAVLGRARRPVPPSPYFTRRVLREVALLEETEPAWRRWAGRLFAGRRVGVAAGAICAVLLTAASVGLLPLHISGRRHARLQPQPRAAAVVDPVAATAAAPAGETLSEKDLPVIADLDELMDTEENQVWLDEDTNAS